MSPRRALVVVVVALLGAGCRAAGEVAVRVSPDGSGQVTVQLSLDRAAVTALDAGGGKLGERVRVLDLVAAGWTTQGWKPSSDGGATLQLEKSYRRPSDLAAVVAEVSGPHGPLRDVVATRSRSLFSSHDEVSMVADLEHLDATVRSDPTLAARLEDAGVDPTALDAELLRELRRSFDLTVRVELPGGARREWNLQPGDRRRLAIASSQRATPRLVLAVAAAALAAIALGLLVAASVSAARRRRARRRPGGSEATWSAARPGPRGDPGG